ADNWNKVSTPTTTIQTDNALTYGTKSQQYTTSGAGMGIASDPVVHSRIKPTNIVLFSAYIKAASGTPSVTLKIEAFNASAVSQASTPSVGPPPPSFARYSVAFPLPANTAYVVVSVFNAAADAINMKVDQTQLEVVAATSATAKPYAPGKGVFV